MQDEPVNLRAIDAPNGAADPWSSGGVTPDILEPELARKNDLIAIVIPNGGHHVDLMFSHEDDTEDIKKVREIELEAIRRWIRKARSESGRVSPSSPESSSSFVTILQFA